MDIVPLLPTDYYKTDSHINFDGARKLARGIVECVHLRRSAGAENESTLDLSITPLYHGDLSSEYNWGAREPWQRDLLDTIVRDVDTLNINADRDQIGYTQKGLKSLIHTAPIEFRFLYSRPSEYYENGMVESKERILFLCDSTTVCLLKPILNCYFKSVFYYWDHWFWNERLISWYRPDVILDVRTERFMWNVPDIFGPFVLEPLDISWENFRAEHLHQALYFYRQFATLQDIQENRGYLAALAKHWTALPDVDPLPPDFDCKAYVELNPDLRHLNELEAMFHFLHHGHPYENRAYR